MNFNVAQEVSDIDSVSGSPSLRAELSSHLEDDGGDFLLEHALKQFDDEFKIFYGHIVNSSNLVSVELDDRISQVIRVIQLHHPLTDDQCASLLLDLTRILMINKRRHIG